MVFYFFSLKTDAEESPGMKDIHSEILKKYLPEFNEKLDVKKMVESLVKAEIITEHNPGLGQAVSEVLEEPTKKKQVEKLICDVLPQLGPMAFDSFFTALKSNQLQFAHDLKQLINRKFTFVGEVFHQLKRDITTFLTF